MISGSGFGKGNESGLEYCSSRYSYDNEMPSIGDAEN